MIVLEFIQIGFMDQILVLNSLTFMLCLGREGLGMIHGDESCNYSAAGNYPPSRSLILYRSPNTRMISHALMCQTKPYVSDNTIEKVIYSGSTLPSNTVYKPL
jgi:hypothetical protein